MRYPISKNIKEIYQMFISRLDYYTILYGNIKQLIPIDSPRSQLSNDVSLFKIRNKRNINENTRSRMIMLQYP